MANFSKFIRSRLIIDPKPSDDLQQGDSQTVHIIFERITLDFDVGKFKLAFKLRRSILKRAGKIVLAFRRIEIQSEPKISQLPMRGILGPLEDEDVGWLDIAMSYILFLQSKQYLN